MSEAARNEFWVFITSPLLDFSHPLKMTYKVNMQKYVVITLRTLRHKSNIREVTSTGWA